MKEREEDIVEMVIKMYDKFRSNEPIWSLANQLALAKLRTESLEMEREEKTAKRIEEGIKQGIEQGIEIGREEGVEIGKKETLKKEKQRCIKILKKQYHQDCQEWVESLTGKQLEEIIELIFKEADFKVFKQKIDMIK